MTHKIILILEIITYFALIPIVFRSLMALDFSKIFRKNHVAESQIIFFLVLITIVKIVGDFFIDIAKAFLTLFGVL